MPRSTTKNERDRSEKHSGFRDDTQRERTIRMVLTALFSALAYILVFVFRIKVSFLTFDAKDAVLTVGGLFLGPVAAAVMSFLVALLEFITVSDTGVIGLVMNFLSSAAFSVTVSLIYKRHRTITGAVAGLLSGVFTMTGIMLWMNLVLTPLYMAGATVQDVITMIPTLLLPFNLTKAVLNAALVLVLYKPVALALHRAHLWKSGEVIQYRMNGKSIAVLVSGLLLIAASVVFFLLYLNGSFSLV